MSFFLLFPIPFLSLIVCIYVDDNFMDSIDEERVPPRKKPRRAKRKAVDPTFKPARNKHASDSDSGFDSEPSINTRRQNPPRSSTVTNDGVRRNYSEARTADSARVNKKASTEAGGTRKRKTRDGDKENGDNDMPRTEEYDSTPATENDIGKPVPEGKTTWFFSRMLQGMKNFWTKNDTTTTTTSTHDNNHNNDAMDYSQDSSGKKPSNGPKKSSDSSKETEVYDSKESEASAAGISHYIQNEEI